MSKEISFNEIYQLIMKYNSIIIHRHNHPDGDALGAQLGLKHAILATFPNKQVFCVGEEKEEYNFIGRMDEIEDSCYQNALVIVVDTGGEALISDKRFRSGDVLLKIDHHIPHENYGDFHYVDTTAESCCGIISDLIKETPLLLTNEVSSPLFTGLITDSGRFRYGSHIIQSLERAKYLMQTGIDIQKIYNDIYIEDLEYVKLKGDIIRKIIVTNKKVAYFIFNKDEVAKYTLDAYELGSSYVNIMQSLKGVLAWVSFVEDPNGIIVCELRSKEDDINQVARKYGGGGHLQASGVRVTSWDKTISIIEDMEKVLERVNINVR